MKRVSLYLFISLFLFSITGLAQEEQDILILESAVIKAAKADGKAWDVGVKGMVLPDVFVEFFIPVKEQWVSQYKSKLIKDTLKPEWKEKIPIIIQPGMKLKITVWDKDIKNDDLIGETEITIPQIGEKELKVNEFGQVESVLFSIQWVFPSLSDEELAKFVQILGDAKKALTEGEKDPKKALEIYQPVIDWYNQNKDKEKSIAKFTQENGLELCEGVGDAYAMQSEYKNAEEWYKESIRFAQDKSKRGEVFYKIASICASQEKKMECMYYLEESFKEDEAEGKTQWVEKFTQDEVYKPLLDLPEFQSLIKKYKK